MQIEKSEKIWCEYSDFSPDFYRKNASDQSLPEQSWFIDYWGLSLWEGKWGSDELTAYQLEFEDLEGEREQ